MSTQPSPLYSCIIPVHNGRDHLDRCLASVVAQTEQRLEVILLDDASTDGSLELMSRWAVRYPERLRVIPSSLNEARGIVATYRIGASLASGHFLAFLEQDDVWHHCFLESKTRLYEAQGSRDVGVIFSPYLVMTDGFYGFDMILRRWLLSLELPRLVPFNNSRSLLRYNNVACFSAFVCRRSLWGLIPEPPDQSMLYFDWWVLAHLSLLCEFIYDSRTHIHWRCSPLTTLGQQTFHEHKTALSSFLVTLYESLDRESSRHGEGNRQEILRHQQLLPLQIRLIHDCNAKAIFDGLTKSPNWTLRMLASLVVNRIKKTA